MARKQLVGVVSNELLFITDALPYPEYSASLSRLRRADERTRTADLFITNDNSHVAGVCTGLQIPHI